MKRKIVLLSLAFAMLFIGTADAQKWVKLFNGKDLDGWTPRGGANWKVENGVIIGQSPKGQGHLYAWPNVTDFEVKAKFRLTKQDGEANSGFYFRANPPEKNPDGYPEGFEAQICHSQKASTGWVWKPGHGVYEPQGKVNTKDGVWFEYKIRCVGDHIEFFIDGKKVNDCHDSDYKKGFFAIQCHNKGMTIEAKDIYYRSLTK